METLYWAGIFLSAVGTLGLTFGWVRSSRPLIVRSAGLVMLGALLLGVSLGIRYHQAWNFGYMPMSGAENSFALLGWFFLLSALYLFRWPRFVGLSILLSGTGILSVFLAVFLPDRSLPSLSQANALVFATHVMVLFLAIASFFIALFSGVFYLLAQRDLKDKRFSSWLAMLPSLEALDRVAIRSVSLGAVALGVGMGSGIYLAHTVWATNWIGDPKFILTMITGAWYVLLLLVRRFLGWRGRRFVFMMLIGFLLLLMTFLGTALFFASQHSDYAFHEAWRYAWIWS